MKIKKKKQLYKRVEIVERKEISPLIVRFRKYVVCIREYLHSSQAFIIFLFHATFLFILFTLYLNYIKIRIRYFHKLYDTRTYIGVNSMTFWHFFPNFFYFNYTRKELFRFIRRNLIGIFFLVIFYNNRSLHILCRYVFAIIFFFFFFFGGPE